MKMYSMLCMMCICEYASFAVPSDSADNFETNGKSKGFPLFL